MSITTTGMMESSVDAQVNNGRDYRQGGVLVIACGMGYWLLVEGDDDDEETM